MVGGPSGDVLQMVQLWSHTTSNWEMVDTRAIANLDVTVDVAATGGLGRFVNQNNGEVRAKITLISPQFSSNPYSWSLEMDQAVWRVGLY